MMAMPSAAPTATTMVTPDADEAVPDTVESAELPAPAPAAVAALVVVGSVDAMVDGYTGVPELGHRRIASSSTSVSVSYIFGRLSVSMGDADLIIIF